MTKMLAGREKILYLRVEKNSRFIGQLVCTVVLRLSQRNASFSSELREKYRQLSKLTTENTFR